MKSFLDVHEQIPIVQNRKSCGKNVTWDRKEFHGIFWKKRGFQFCRKLMTDRAWEPS